MCVAQTREKKSTVIERYFRLLGSVFRWAISNVDFVCVRVLDALFMVDRSIGLTLDVRTKLDDRMLCVSEQCICCRHRRPKHTPFATVANNSNTNKKSSTAKITTLIPAICLVWCSFHASRRTHRISWWLLRRENSKQATTSAPPPADSTIWKEKLVVIQNCSHRR